MLHEGCSNNQWEPYDSQVGKLSSGDPLATRRELYLRNVSSKDLAQKVSSLEEPEDDALPATRHEGDTIAFHRYVTAPIDANRAPFDASVPAQMSTIGITCRS